ncbi:hypothetical protein SP15_058 [Bacillus phage SP-15]|uniref:Uncharacterized protein n=1 Tax=Bacillus phage SP-15 TaxID=1792032 RepID=A0A127AWA0_9CAUD|nr:hypothetical protein SP15_058 [Bacillus phage SP-15]AMM44857.1 hypothetical protein SP15_058 [Bacillus phage SP-15]
MENIMDKAAKWTVNTKIEKYATQADFAAGVVTEVQDIKGNALLSEGINLLWTLVCGGSGTPFDATAAHIGVGNDQTPVDKGQTGLLGISKLYKAMDAGYPQYGSNDKVVFKATFGGTEANFQWHEWTVANGDGTADDSAVINLNRKVEPMGEKYAGSTWVITVEISLT